MTNDTPRFLHGGARMGAAIAAFDWASTPLGPIEGWEPALKVATGMMTASAFPKCLCWGPELTSLYNDAFVPILGAKHPCLGRPFKEIWAEAWGDIGSIVNRALSGEATFIQDFPLTINRSGEPEEVYQTFCYSPVRDELGTIRGMLDTVIETTGQVRAERMSRLRNRELVHRSRNAYALVSALISQTHRTSASMQEAQQKIQSRLTSLVRAQDILAQSHGAEAAVEELVRQTLEPFASDLATLTIAGPDVLVGREQVTSLALALHELATNAAKYGALSTAGGRVAVRWDLRDGADGQMFTLDWIETGGPVVEPVTRRGFGSFLIEEMLAKELDGKVELATPPEGLRFRLTCEASTLS